MNLLILHIADIVVEGKVGYPFRQLFEKPHLHLNYTFAHISFFIRPVNVVINQIIY